MPSRSKLSTKQNGVNGINSQAIAYNPGVAIAEPPKNVKIKLTAK